MEAAKAALAGNRARVRLVTVYGTPRQAVASLRAKDPALDANMTMAVRHDEGEPSADEEGMAEDLRDLEAWEGSGDR